MEPAPHRQPLRALTGKDERRLTHRSHPPRDDVGTRLTGGAAIPTYELAFKFVLGNPSLCCALSGMENTKMVEENAALASREATDKCPTGAIVWLEPGGKVMYGTRALEARAAAAQTPATAEAVK